MGHLGEGTEITTVQDKEIVLTGSDGQYFRMKVADLAEAVRQVMSVVTSEKNGLMGSAFLRSIYNLYSGINPNSTFDTGITSGGLIMFQNASSVHDIGIAIMYAEGRGKVICEAPSVSFFGGNGILDIRKSSSDSSIKIVNNSNIQQTAAVRIICTII